MKKVVKKTMKPAKKVKGLAVAKMTPGSPAEMKKGGAMYKKGGKKK